MTTAQAMLFKDLDVGAITHVFSDQVVEDHFLGQGWSLISDLSAGELTFLKNAKAKIQAFTGKSFSTFDPEYYKASQCYRDDGVMGQMMVGTKYTVIYRVGPLNHDRYEVAGCQVDDGNGNNVFDVESARQFTESDLDFIDAQKEKDSAITTQLASLMMVGFGMLAML